MLLDTLLILVMDVSVYLSIIISLVLIFVDGLTSAPIHPKW